MLDRFLAKLQDEAKKYAQEALTDGVSEKTTFEYGTHHGVMKGFGLAEQWLLEMLEEEEDDDTK
jgi:hypothetical protein